MKSLSLSVIIPTYNRKDVLSRSLSALFSQTYKGEYEIIVINDGSTDGTEKEMKRIMKNAPVSLKYFRQKNKGAAAARNVGIKNAEGKILLFIGDDIIPTPNLLEEHINYHNRYPEKNKAVSGYVTWHPDLEVTPFMWWLENGGPQFSYNDITTTDGEIDCTYFCSSNISLKRKFLLSGGLFNEDFPYASYEDTELRYRLEEKGLKIIYNPNAVGYHFHPISISSYCKERQLKKGISEVILCTKNLRFRHKFDADVEYYKKLFSLNYSSEKMEKLIKIIRKRELSLERDSPKLHSLYKVLTDFYSLKGSFLKFKEIVPNFDLIQKLCSEAIKAEKRSDHKRTIQLYRKIISFCPNFLPVRFMLAKVLENISRYDQAILEYKEILGKEPRQSNVLIQLGAIHSQQGKFKEAEEELKKALSLEPPDRNIKANILTALGNLYSQQQKFKEAEEKLKEALSLEPPDGNIVIFIHYAMGSNYEREESLNKAKEEFEKLAKETSSFANKNRFVGGVHFHLGCIYRSLGEKERAIREFENCLKLIPDHRKAREIMRHLLKEGLGNLCFHHMRRY